MPVGSKFPPDVYTLMDMTGQDLQCKHVWHAGGEEIVKWCEHIQKYIQDGSDAATLSLGSNVSVPVFPTQDIWCLIHISTLGVGASGKMTLEYTPDIGRKFSISLGLWNPGEGRSSMRAVIVDYLLGECDPNENFKEEGIRTRCPSSTHGLREARQMSENGRDLSWKWACLWNIVMEKACTPCIQLAAGVDDGISTAGKDFNNRPAGLPARNVQDLHVNEMIGMDKDGRYWYRNKYGGMTTSRES